MPGSAVAAHVVSDVKRSVQRGIVEQAPRFIQFGRDIHAHPELAFGEEYAAGRITQLLIGEGFSVRQGVGGLPTALVATIGNGPLHLAFCAEYDAMPAVGHVCGHNIIAGAAVTAAVGLRDVVDEIGLTAPISATCRR